MKYSSVDSQGKVTIPSAIRRELNIREGSKIAFALVNDHIEMRVENPMPADPVPVPAAKSGFGMLKSNRPPVPVDFDPADLFKP